MRKIWTILFMSLFSVFLYGFIVPSEARAATYTVTKTADTNDGTCNADCSFREAVAAANANAGEDTIEFNIPTSDGSYVAASGTTHAYWFLTISTVVTLSDDSGVTINGYSQVGASRNTSLFGETLNTVLTIKIFYNVPASSFNITGDNNHLAGLNLTTSRTGSSVITINTSSNNWIEGNFFGSDIAGISGSGGGSFQITNSSNNVFGTDGDGNEDPGERNLFMSSQTTSSLGYIASTSGDNVTIAGNYFGVDKTSRVCTTSTLAASDIIFSAGSGHRIGTNLDGTSDLEEANILACVNNTFRGELRIGGISDSVIQGNFIGTNFYSDDFNTLTDRPGFVFRDTASSNITVKRNTIANNTTKGLEVLNSSLYTGLTFRENIIYNNGSIDIDLAANGTTLNDPGDTDTGPNDLMNYPTISSVTHQGSGKYWITGELDGNPLEAPFIIEICLSGNHSSGHGGCIQSLATFEISEAGSWETQVTTSQDDPFVRFSALATNANGSTSEFGPNAGMARPTTATATPDIPLVFSEPFRIVEEENIVALVASNVFNYEAYLTQVETPKTEAFRLPGTHFWQAGGVHEIWWKSWFNDAKILPSEINSPFTLIIKYDPTKFEKNLPERNLRLAYSADNKIWKIIPSAIINLQRKEVALVTKQGGYYMLVSGYPPVATPTRVQGASVEQIEKTVLNPVSKVTTFSMTTITPLPTPSNMKCVWFFCF